MADSCNPYMPQRIYTSALFEENLVSDNTCSLEYRLPEDGASPVLLTAADMADGVNLKDFCCDMVSADWGFASEGCDGGFSF